MTLLNNELTTECRAATFPLVNLNVNIGLLLTSALLLRSAAVGC